jgi:hypothetical protein
MESIPGNKLKAILEAVGYSERANRDGYWAMRKEPGLPIMIQQVAALHPDAIQEVLDKAEITPERYLQLLESLKATSA